MITIFHRPRKTHWSSEEYEENGEKLIRSVEVEEEPTTKFSIEDTPSELKIKYYTPCCELPVEGEFVLNKAQYKGQVIFCAIIQTDERNKQIVYPHFGRTTSESATRTYGKSFDENFLARVCFETNGDINIFLFHRIDNVSGFKNVIVKPDETSVGVLVKNSKVFAEGYKKHKIKAKMLGNLDSFNSLAYLEVQVDALTRALLQLQESGKISEDIVDLLQVGDKASVLNVKRLEKCEEEITKHKTNVRNLQKKFYDAK